MIKKMGGRARKPRNRLKVQALMWMNSSKQYRLAKISISRVSIPGSFAVAALSYWMMAPVSNSLVTTALMKKAAKSMVTR